MSNPPRQRLWLWAPVVLYCAAIYLLSSVSDVPQIPSGLSDKAAHTMLYSGLGFLTARALAGGLGLTASWSIVWLAIAASVLYGLTDEVHQLFVPRRQFDLRDLLADALGAALGAAAVWLWGIIAPIRDIPPRPDS